MTPRPQIPPALTEPDRCEPQPVPDRGLHAIDAEPLASIGRFPRRPAKGSARRSEGVRQFFSLLAPTPLAEHGCASYQTSPITRSDLGPVEHKEIKPHMGRDFVIIQDAESRIECHAEVAEGLTRL